MPPNMRRNANAKRSGDQIRGKSKAHGEMGAGNDKRAISGHGHNVAAPIIRELS